MTPECTCPEPLDRSPGTCERCTQRAAIVAAFFDEHPGLDPRGATHGNTV